MKEQVSFDLRTICTNAPWRGYRNWKRIAFRWRSRAGKSCCLAGRHHNNTLITIIITLLIKATNWTFNLVVLFSPVGRPFSSSKEWNLSPKTVTKMDRNEYFGDFRTTVEGRGRGFFFLQLAPVRMAKSTNGSVASSGCIPSKTQPAENVQRLQGSP